MGEIVHCSVRGTGMSVVYDLGRGAIVPELTDYSIWMRKANHSDPKTVAQTMGHLVKFWTYLQPQADVGSISDRKLSRFFEAELDAIMKNPRSRGSELSARNTLNQKVSAVLTWLFWMQRTRRCPPRTIGSMDCSVTASAFLRGGAFTAQDWQPKSIIRSPHFRPNASSAGFVPAVSRDVYENLRQHLLESSTSVFLGRRDQLFVDIATEAGFRRGSICSLTVDQFEELDVRNASDVTLPLRPKSQKFGYTFEFEVSTLLLNRVQDFIDGPRRALVDRLGVSTAVTQGRIFLSEKTGKPITGRAMTQRISEAMRAIGCRKGQAAHVFRGLFANELVDAEIEDRLELGLDTSTESIAHAVAPQLGQKSAKSLFPYIANHVSKKARKRLASRD
jgi:integrase